MILEGAMIVIASIALTVWHPALIFKTFWNLDRARAEIREKREDGKEDGRYGVLMSDRATA